MKRSIPFIVLLLVFSAAPLAASMAKPIVHYDFHVRLDPAKKTVEGYETLTWLNDSQAPVSELRFHLYLNAFKNSRSTLMTESGRAYRDVRRADDEWGFITVRKLAVPDGPDLTSAMSFIQPDDGNPDDRTVMRLALPSPVKPGEKITLRIDFMSKLPKVMQRSGYSGNFFMVAQWFPKVGVLWNGDWNCHQYHAHSEFFADFGEFKAELTAPAEYVVGATGKRVGERTNADGTKTYDYHQEDIHDFAWTACPDFVEFHEKFIQAEPRVDTEMILLVHRAHLRQKDRYAQALRHGIEFYSTSYGAYPYETITLVDPAPGAMAAGGMEYPTLFTADTTSWMPRGFRMPELVTIHEFGHGYWYGMVASNEFEEAWLDEGINTYSEIKAMARYYGEDSSVIDIGGVKISDQAYQRAMVIGSGRFDPVVKNSWDYISGGSYSLNVYSKAGLMMLTLEKLLGEDVMAKVMRAYFERWKFRHPRTADFVQVAEDVSGRDLEWFFSQALGSPDKLDYGISDLSTVEVTDPRGVFDEKSPPAERPQGAPKASSQAPKMYRSEVVASRFGEWIFPQEILVVFKDGDRIRETWDGRDRWKRFVYFKRAEVVSATVDPDHKMILDVNYTNNSRTLVPKKAGILKYALGFMEWFQGFLSLVSL